MGFKRNGIEAIGICRGRMNEKAISQIQASRMEVSSLSWAGGFTGAGGLSFDDAVRDGCLAVDQARQIGARMLLMHAGPINGHIVKHARRLATDGLVRVAEYASPRGVQLALQPMHEVCAPEWSFVTRCEEALEIVDACRHSGIGLSVNTFHSAADPMLAQHLPQMLRHLWHVQLSDGLSRVNSDLDRRLLGDGELGIASIVRRLVRRGYKGHFEVDACSECVRSRDGDALLREARQRFARIWTEVG